MPLSWNEIKSRALALTQDWNEKQVQVVEAAAQGVLAARAQFPNTSLADLYDPTQWHRY